jgi:hypothetical protein
MRQFPVSDAARELTRRMGRTIPPRLISDLFYQRRLDDERCPVIGRFRLIPESYLSTIETVLRAEGVPADAADLAEVAHA